MHKHLDARVRSPLAADLCSRIRRSIYEGIDAFAERSKLASWGVLMIVDLGDTPEIPGSYEEGEPSHASSAQVVGGVGLGVGFGMFGGIACSIVRRPECGYEAELICRRICPR